MREVESNRIVQGDTLATLKKWPSGFVQCIVTSPPYWGLRDYNAKGQLGLEKSVTDYVKAITRVFRELRRVLKDDGICWMNIGDTYSGSWGDYGGQNRGGGSRINHQAYTDLKSWRPPASFQSGIRPKNLCLIPARIAIALQDDGWNVRSDVIWEKPNPMPESCRDRPTKAHEYIFLLTKSERYFYDYDAVTEPVSPNTHMRISQNLADQIGSERANGGTLASRPMKAVFKGSAKLGRREDGVKANETFRESVVMPVLRRNLRTVWNIPTQGYTDAHFAAFPEAIPARCILASTKKGDIVLDPFSGRGTTSYVAKRLGRRWLGIELNPQYVAIAERNIAAEPDPPPELPGLERR